MSKNDVCKCGHERYKHSHKYKFCQEGLRDIWCKCKKFTLEKKAIKISKPEEK